jgi:pimeloyl-ACP methyl ester carboxylesterase|tara:strand:+ start:2125 stop:3039 length:915 start_codon:yes stop_codon:yes gene_type:complete
MPKKIILAIHGLGNKPSKRTLTNYWIKSIQEGLDQIKSPLKMPEFEMIYWADIFHEKPLTRRKKKPDDPFYYHEPYTKSDNKPQRIDESTRVKIIEFLGHQINQLFLKRDLSLNHNVLTDFILENYFKELSAYYHEVCNDQNKIECFAKDLIQRRTIIALEKFQDHEIMLIGHSMGSIIAFDVLTFLVPKLKIHSFVTIGSPLGLPIVVGKIAAEQKIIGEVGDILHTPPGVTHHWKNFSDLHDNIALKHRLADDFKANKHGVKPNDSLVFNDYMIDHLANPHKSFGYLRAPEFSNFVVDFLKN